MNVVAGRSMIVPTIDQEIMRSAMLVIILAILIVAMGCDGVAGNNARSVTQTTNGNSSPIASSTNIPSTNSNIPISVPANADGLLTRNTNQSKPFPGQNQPRLATQSAPDDSEVSVVLNENIVQTRVFKSHPTLLKIVESTIPAGSTNKSIKVYFKDGSVTEIPISKIGDPMAESAAKIVAAVGSK